LAGSRVASWGASLAAQTVGQWGDSQVESWGVPLVVQKASSKVFAWDGHWDGQKAASWGSQKAGTWVVSRGDRWVSGSALRLVVD